MNDFFHRMDFFNLFSYTIYIFFMNSFKINSNAIMGTIIITATAIIANVS